MDCSKPLTLIYDMRSVKTVTATGLHNEGWKGLPSNGGQYRHVVTHNDRYRMIVTERF